MKLVYHPTVLGAPDALALTDPASVARAWAFLRSQHWDMVLVALDCATCGIPVPRGDVVRMRRYRATTSGSRPECRTCAMKELLPLADALAGAPCPAA